LNITLIKDIRLPGTYTYINQYQAHTLTKPNKEHKLYLERLGLLTIKYTDKLCNLANFRKPNQVLNKISRTLIDTSHKIWTHRCHVNTFIPDENLGVGAIYQVVEKEKVEDQARVDTG
jgi:hypothetical protein